MGFRAVLIVGREFPNKRIKFAALLFYARRLMVTLYKRMGYRGVRCRNVGKIDDTTVIVCIAHSIVSIVLKRLF